MPLAYYYETTPVHEAVEELLNTQRAPVYIVHFSQAAALERAQALASAKVATREQRDAIAELVFADVPARELHADVLRFDAEAARARQAPSDHEQDAADPAAEIEEALRVRLRAYRLPRRGEVIHGKAMTAPALHEPKRRGDGIARELVRNHGSR